MTYPLPAEAVALQERVARFVREDLAPLAAGVDPEAVTADVRRTVAARSEAAGLQRLAIPVADGGLGAGPLLLAVAREALALSGHPLAAYVLGNGPGILRLANTDAQRAALYAPALRGEKRAAFAFTEAREGPATAATRTAEGFRLNGRKAFVTGGPEADWIVVVATVAATGDSPGGTALLVVDREAPGVEQGAIITTIDGSCHCSFTFTDTPVPAGRLLGTVGQGLPQALGNIRDMRMRVAAQAVGWSRWACRTTLAQIEQPHRSGAPLAEREQVQGMFGEMVARTLAAQSTLYRAADDLEAGATDVTGAAVAKLTATETLGFVVDQAIQLHGALALVRGHPLEQMYRAARSLRIAEGTTEILRLTIAREARRRGAASL